MEKESKQQSKTQEEMAKKDKELIHNAYQTFDHILNLKAKLENPSNEKLSPSSFQIPEAKMLELEQFIIKYGSDLFIPQSQFYPQVFNSSDDDDGDDDEDESSDHNNEEQGEQEEPSQIPKKKIQKP